MANASTKSNQRRREQNRTIHTGWHEPAWRPGSLICAVHWQGPGQVSFQRAELAATELSPQPDVQVTGEAVPGGPRT